MKNLIIYSITLYIFIFLIACDSNHSLAVKSCIKKVAENNGNLDDAKIICPCLATKMIQEYKGKAELIAKIRKWDISDLPYKNKNLLNKKVRACYYLKGVSFPELYSDYPPNQREGLKRWIKNSYYIHSQDTIGLNLDKYSDCVLRKIEKKYSYHEFMGDVKNFDFSEKKEHLDSLMAFMKECIKNQKN